MPIDREKATLSLDEPVSRVRLVSPARASALEKLGVRTLRDLLTHFPRSYIDLSQVETCGTARIGEVCTIRGTVHEIKLKKPATISSSWRSRWWTRHGHSYSHLLSPAVADGSGEGGDAVAVSGKVTFDYGYKRMTNPFIEVIRGKGGHRFGGAGASGHREAHGSLGATHRGQQLEAAEGLFDPLPLGLRLRFFSS
ncbi:MAG: hypothetical protein ACLTDR_10995 [Adlercreutzia equolifaciens]